MSTLAEAVIFEVFFSFRVLEPLNKVLESLYKAQRQGKLDHFDLSVAIADLIQEEEMAALGWSRYHQRVNGSEYIYGQRLWEFYTDSHSQDRWQALPESKVVFYIGKNIDRMFDLRRLLEQFIHDTPENYTTSEDELGWTFDIFLPVFEQFVEGTRDIFDPESFMSQYDTIKNREQLGHLRRQFLDTIEDQIRENDWTERWDRKSSMVQLLYPCPSDFPKCLPFQQRTTRPI